MFNKKENAFGRAKYSLNANYLHSTGTSKRGMIHTSLDEQTRRMFNEWEIESRADRRGKNADGSVNIANWNNNPKDDIKINKRRPYSDYYKYGLIK